MSKPTLCKLKKHELKERLPELAELLPAASHICKKCARIAHDKEWLCKPLRIAQLREEIAGEDANWESSNHCVVRS